MASSPLPGGPRHVGRVIDPSVREDGEPEPALELDAERPAFTETSDPPQLYEHDSAPLARGPRLRERLLERAERAEHPQHSEPVTHTEYEPPLLGDLDQIGLPEEPARSEPEPIRARPRAPSAPLFLARRARLSPNLTALFTTLLGVAAVASLIALAMNVDLAPPNTATATSAEVNSEPEPEPPLDEAPPPKRVREKLPGPWRIADAKDDASLRLIEGKIGQDAFLKALEKAGVPTREQYRIITSLKGIRDFDRCKQSDRFSVLLARKDARVKAFEYSVGPGEVYQSREGDDGLLKGVQLDLKLARNEVTGALLYDGKSFDASAERSGFDPGLRRVVARALEGHLGMDELDRGDRLRLIVQEMTVLGEFGNYTGVESLEFRPKDSGRSPIRVYYFAAAGERGYYDAEGRAPFDGGWRKPVKDAPMTSPFNLKRMHPVLKKVMPHLGMDFGAPTGTPVGAASFGTVSFIGFSGPSGNLVKVTHPGGIETGYAHLSRFAEGLKVGDSVKRMQLVGYVGSTGRSTGPHLHFSATRNGAAFDPATLRLDAMRTLPKDAREAFAIVKAKYDERLEAIPLPEPLLEIPQEVRPNADSSPPSPASDEPGESDEEPPFEQPKASATGTKPSPSPASNTPGSGKSNVHLTDKELLQLSGASDDGEVDE